MNHQHKIKNLGHNPNINGAINKIIYILISSKLLLMDLNRLIRRVLPRKDLDLNRLINKIKEYIGRDLKFSMREFKQLQLLRGDVLKL